MPFLHNAWYCVGYPEDIVAGNTKSLVVLGEPLVLFRGADNQITALHDRCPHRFAPLLLGKVVDGQLQCPYHGLRFDAGGRCSLNPHGDRSIPKAAQVRHFPVLVRHEIVWVWMGDVEKADPAALPDFAVLDARPGWSRINGYLRSAANYRLIIDNLLDLSHARYLHPFLSGVEGQRKEPSRIETRLDQDGDSIVAVLRMQEDGVTPLVHLLWDRGALPALIDAWNDMRWSPPSMLLLDSAVTAAGRPREEGVAFPSAHLLTPETEDSTHYFFVSLRDAHVGNEEVSQLLLQGALAAFSNEDSPMIQACQRNMGGTTDLMSLNPVLLQTDASAIRVRRLLDARLAAEAARKKG